MLPKAAQQIDEVEYFEQLVESLLDLDQPVDWIAMSDSFRWTDAEATF